MNEELEVNHDEQENLVEDTFEQDLIMQTFLGTSEVFEDDNI